MNVFIRVDVAKHIGTGHFQRCLTLAKEFRSRGNHVVFFLRDYNDGLTTEFLGSEFHIEIIGYSVIPNKELLVEDDWLVVSEQQDAIDFMVAIKNLSINPDLIVIDHYSLSGIWQKSITNNLDVKLLVIDDLANRKHDCDILVDQNYYRNYERRYSGLVPQECALLLGPSYTILRTEFLELRKEQDKIAQNIVLVNFGGVGNKAVWDKFIPALQETSNKYQYYVVTGKLSQSDFSDIHQKLTKYGIECCEQTTEMAKLMSHSVYSIGACGSTVWERFCLGVNSALIDLADNQKELISYLSDQELIDYLGNSIDISHKDILSHLVHLDLISEIYLKRKQAIQELVDGLGASRIVSHIELIINGS